MCTAKHVYHVYRPRCGSERFAQLWPLNQNLTADSEALRIPVPYCVALFQKNTLNTAFNV